MDAKLKKVKHKYGITGYGLYWYCVELIAGSVEKNNITFQLEEDAEIIALEWSLDQLKIEEIMRYFVDIGLFEFSDSKITCLKLAKRLDDTNSKNPHIKQILKDLSLTNSDKLRVTPTDSEKVVLDKTRLDKTIKDKNSINPTFDEIQLYISENNLNVDCAVFYTHYKSNDWVNSQGSKITNWKNVIRGWEKTRRATIKNNLNKCHANGVEL